MSELINGDAGRIGFLIKGEYQETETYRFLDVVYYNGSSYVAKKDTTGNRPAENNEYWQILASAGQGGINTDDFALRSIYGDDAISLGRVGSVGRKSIAFGNNLKATKLESVAFGEDNESSGSGAVVCGFKNIAMGENSFSTGNRNISVENYSFSEGCGNIVLGYGSHAENCQNIAGARYVFKIESYNVEEKKFTFDDTYTGFSEAFAALETGSKLFVQNTNFIDTASIYTVFAKESDGKSVTVNEDIPATNYSVLFATIIKAYNNYPGCHVEGRRNVALNSCAHAEGYETEARGDSSHAEGLRTVSSGSGSHAEGDRTVAVGKVTIGGSTYVAPAHAEGFRTIARGNQHAQGHYNDETKGELPRPSGTGSGTAFVIGNGTFSTRSNSVRIDYNGKLWCKQAYSSTGADYAELFEWADGNEENEDRRGYFVTIDGKKIKKASSGDYIVGIISGNPSVIGNTDMEWYGQFMRDEFGTFIKESYKETLKEPCIDEDGNDEEIEHEVDVEFYKVNPDYDPDAPYTFRLDRPEWDAVGMLGVLPVRDDGTCEVGRFCKCANGGIATLATERGFDTYMVLERIADNIVSVILK